MWTNSHISPIRISYRAGSAFGVLNVYPPACQQSFQHGKQPETKAQSLAAPSLMTHIEDNRLRSMINQMRQTSSERARRLAHSFTSVSSHSHNTQQSDVTFFFSCSYKLLLKTVWCLVIKSLTIKENKWQAANVGK